MTAIPFADALESYTTALASIEGSASRLTPRQVMSVLTARDAIRRALMEARQDSPTSLMTVIELDQRLRRQADSICRAVNLADWRASFNPPPKAWWWSLESYVRQNRWDRFDWMLGAIVVVLLTVSLSLLVDVSNRFFSGGPDAFGSFAITAQSVLTLLVAGGVLTKAGREMVERMLASLRIPKDLWQAVKLGLAVFLVLSFFSFHRSLPQIAIAYNNSGLEDQRAGRLASAQFNYARALKLNPDYTEAHYNLGSLYEDLQDADSAKTEYQIAVRGGSDAAYNNLARLNILDEHYSAAIPLALKGLDLAQDDAVRYDLLKNLGWARLGQKRYSEAKASLQDAIDLAVDRAPAHCLLAQVLESEGDSQSAAGEWDNCLKYADGRNPDEDAWIGMARAALNVKEPTDAK